MARIHDLLDRQKSMRSRRDPWMEYWQQLADIYLPNQADFTTKKMAGEARGVGIYDGTPRLALRDLATTIDGLVKPKSSNWFDVEIADDDLAEVDESKIWLEEVKNRMWNAIYRKDARFIQRSGEVDLALAAFGWGVLWTQENKAHNGLMFKSFHNSQVSIDENSEGVIDCIAIEEMLTPRQAESLYRAYGKEPGKHIRDAMANRRKTNEKMFDFVQLVLPRDDRDATKLNSKGMAFSSVLLDVKGEETVLEQGYHEFPAAVPRWETSPGEIYARSPGMIALPDAQTLQAMGKTLLVGGQRAVDPPMWVANDSILSPLRTFPGGITVVDVSDTNGPPLGHMPVSSNLPVGRDMQNDYRRQVEAAFFKNVFNLPVEGPQMTATEIIARKEEFIRVIGPVFGRLETDYIGHVVERVFGIMERAGAFPERPEHLLEAYVSFRFKSPIQQARKQIEIAGLGQALNFIAPLAEAQPDILDHFDGDEIVRDAPEWSGLPNKWLRPKKQVEELRAARQQGQVAQQQLAEAGPITEAIRNVAQAESLLKP